MKEVEALVASTLSKSLTEREEKKRVGEFQPLSYWKTLGYDLDLIEKNTPAHMRMMHAQLGECFKVVIHSEISGQIEEKMRSKLLEKKGSWPW